MTKTPNVDYCKDIISINVFSAEYKGKSFMKKVEFYDLVLVHELLLFIGSIWFKSSIMTFSTSRFSLNKKLFQCVILFCFYCVFIQPDVNTHQPDQINNREVVRLITIIPNFGSGHLNITEPHL